MCNLYRSTSATVAQTVWQARNPLQTVWAGAIVAPRKEGPLIRKAHHANDLELVIDRWGLIPKFAETADSGGPSYGSVRGCRDN